MLGELKAAEVIWAATQRLLRFHNDHMPDWEQLADWQHKWLAQMVMMTRMGANLADLHEARRDVARENQWDHPILRCAWDMLEPWEQSVLRFQQYMVVGLTLDYPNED